MRVLLFLFMFLFAVSIFAADVTVAKVGKVNISEKEVNIILNDIVMKQGIDPKTIDQNNPKVAEVKNDIVKNLVQREILLTLAMKSIPKDIDKKTSESYENLKKKYKDPKDFENAMKSAGTNEKEVKEKIKKNLILENYVNSITKDIKITEQEKKDFYQNNKDIFKDPEMVKASHILIKVDDKQNDKDAKSKIDAIYKELKSGKSFEELAKKYSQDGSAANGGDLGFFPRGAMVKEFENVAFSTPVGKYSEPFKTQYGYHIVKVTEKRPAKTYTYEEVSKHIEGKLRMDKLKSILDKKVEEGKKSVKVEILKKY
ncbi:MULTISPECIES: peptidylprolyl isomerase [Calditerrivibrio]|uniref:peptidylprolyl isomerase n=1 Tax=Calditerrivibrio TaxID=545865 RepID=UPI003C73D4B7